MNEKGDITIEQVGDALDGLPEEVRQMVLGRLATQQEQTKSQELESQLFEKALYIADYFYGYEHALTSEGTGSDVLKRASEIATAIQEDPDINNPVYQAALEASSMLYIHSFAWDDEASEEDDYIMKKYLGSPFAVSGLTEEQIASNIKVSCRLDYLAETNETGAEAEAGANNHVAGIDKSINRLYGFSAPLPKRFSYRPFTQKLIQQLEMLGLEFPLTEDPYERFNMDLVEQYPEFNAEYIDGEYVVSKKEV